MEYSYWHKQSAAEPLYPNLLWSRPENATLAGKLLIIGGNAYGFAAAADAYNAANKAGAGIVRVLLPDALQKTVGQVFAVGEYAPSTPSGSFAKTALGEVMPLAQWADGLLLAGDLGRNSETAILIESLLQKYEGPITITKDAIEYVSLQPQIITDRQNSLLVLSFSQLRKLATNLKFTTAFTLDMDLLRTVSALNDLTTKYGFSLITRHLDTFFVAANGQVGTTACQPDERLWRIRTASAASVWWLQNPTQPFEALMTSLVAD